MRKNGFSTKKKKISSISHFFTMTNTSYKVHIQEKFKSFIDKHKNYIQCK